MAKNRCERGEVDWESSFARRAGPDLDGSIIHADVGDDLPVLEKVLHVTISFLCDASPIHDAV